MPSSSQAFLAHLIDYAGMFPPAKLPLREALRNYVHLRKSSFHAWILGRFVCPAARLGEIASLGLEQEDAARLRITALGQPNPSSEGSLARLDDDLRSVQDFRRAWGNEQVVDAMEFSLPKDADLDRLADALAAAPARLAQANLRGFLELPFQPFWREGIEKVSQLLAKMPGAPIGMKLRCGGLAPEAFPGNEDVAHFIVCCRKAQLPWKATAGLHHPLRFWDASLQVWHHGFLNVFVAGMLALNHPLSEADLVQILADRDGRYFRFDEEEFAWKDWTCSVDRTIEIRNRWVSSFGSCSFEEPCEELAVLELI